MVVMNRMVDAVSDKSLGALIFTLGLIGAIAYGYWLFGPIPTGLEALFVAPEMMQSMRWAIVVPIVIAVLAVLFIAMWIGWTMAITPPPTLIEEAVESTNEKA
jgi:uncharacterized membrane protein